MNAEGKRTVAINLFPRGRALEQTVSVNDPSSVLEAQSAHAQKDC